MNGVTKALAWSFLLSVTWLLTGCITSEGGLQPAASLDRVRAHLDVARGYIQLANYQRARIAIDRALTVNNRVARAHGLLALVQEREGDIEMAAASFRKALRLDKNDSRLWNNYGAFLFSQAKYRKACVALQRAAQDSRYERRSNVFENLGLCWLKLDAVESAQNAFSRSVNLNEQQSRSWLELAQIDYQNNACTQARNHYEHFVRTGVQTERSHLLANKISELCANQVKAAGVDDDQ